MNRKHITVPEMKGLAEIIELSLHYGRAVRATWLDNPKPQVIHDVMLGSDIQDRVVLLVKPLEGWHVPDTIHFDDGKVYSLINDACTSPLQEDVLEAVEVG